MSSTASNYDISKLTKGQVLAGSAFFLGFIAAWQTVSSTLQSSYFMLLISLLYGAMMFASSYVEEEQHFWYWMTTTWLGLIWIKWYVLFCTY